MPSWSSGHLRRGSSGCVSLWPGKTVSGVGDVDAGSICSRGGGERSTPGRRCRGSSGCDRGPAPSQPVMLEDDLRSGCGFAIPRASNDGKRRLRGAFAIAIGGVGRAVASGRVLSKMLAICRYDGSSSGGVNAPNASAEPGGTASGTEKVAMSRPSTSGVGRSSKRSKGAGRGRCVRVLREAG